MATSPSAGSVTAARRLPMTLTAALIVLLVIITVVAGMKLFGARAEQSRRSDIRNAARQHALAFTTFDHRHFDTDVNRVLTAATGEFKESYQAGAEGLRDLVATNRAVSTGKVLDVGIVSAAADTARVLVAADAVVTNTASKDPRNRHYRMQLDLTRRDGRWLVSDLQFVG